MPRNLNQQESTFCFWGTLSRRCWENSSPRRNCCKFASRTPVALVLRGNVHRNLSSVPPVPHEWGHELSWVSDGLRWCRLVTTRQHQPQRQCCRQLEELLLVQNSSKPTVLTVGDFLTRTVRPEGHHGRSRHCKLQKCHHRDLAAALHHSTPCYTYWSVEFTLKPPIPSASFVLPDLVVQLPGWAIVSWAAFICIWEIPNLPFLQQ